MGNRKELSSIGYLSAGYRVLKGGNTSPLNRDLPTLPPCLLAALPPFPPARGGALLLALSLSHSLAPCPQPVPTSPPPGPNKQPLTKSERYSSFPLVFP